MFQLFDMDSKERCAGKFNNSEPLNFLGQYYE